MARVAASKKTKEDVVSDGKGSTPASKTGAGTPPAPSFPAENSRNTETAGTPKNAGNATGGAEASPTLPLETPAGDGTPPNALDGNAGGTTTDSEKTGGEENGNGEDGGKKQAGNPPAEGEDAGRTRTLDLPFEVKDGMVEVVSVKRAGKSVYATTGNLITFDKDGKATVLLADALHFLNVPGFEFK